MTPVRAIGLTVAGFTMWVLADTAIKLAGESNLPAYEIVAVQGLTIAMCLAGARAAQRDLRSLWPVRAGAQIARAGLDLCNVLCVVVALRHLPLTIFYIIVFSSPMLIAVLSWLFLRESLPWRKALLIVIGFAGIVIAVNPFAPHAAGDWTGYMACVGCVVFFSSSMVWGRRMTQTERLGSLMFVTAAVTAIGGGAAMLWRAEPLTLWPGLLLPLVGLAVALGNYFNFKALRSISAATVGMFHYTQFVTGAALAWAIWHEQPSSRMIAGWLIIVGSSCYVAAWERKKAVLF